MLMLDILKIALTFGLMVLLLRRKVKIGLVMMISALALAVLYLMQPMDALSASIASLREPIAIKLFLALSLIRILELQLREHGVLKAMTEASRAILKNRKAEAASMPLLIGMLPSVGGAYFSAPMVAESTKDTDLSREDKGFINYWFRHPWECVLPLYPGILLASAISKIELRTFILANLPYAVLIAIGGYWFGLRGIKGEAQTKAALSGSGLWSFAPLVAILLLVMAFHMELQWALLITVIALYVFYGYRPRATWRSIKHGFAPEVLTLIAGVMLFKGIMQGSGAVKNLSAFFIEYNVPMMPTLFFLPLITGLLTGLTVGFVGSTFPLLLSLPNGDAVSAMAFAFAGGFTGVLLSPVHICFVLTREYFNADLFAMYKKMLIPIALVLTGSVAEYLIMTF